MTSSAPEPITEWAEDAPSATPRRRSSPEDYVWPRWWFIPLTLVITAALLAILLAAGRISPLVGVLMALLGALGGLTATLIAHAWAMAIVFAESSRKGVWFAAFPPYMVYYAIVRWRWMAQPTVLFLCGLILAFGTMFGLRWLQP